MSGKIGMMVVPKEGRYGEYIEGVFSVESPAISFLPTVFKPDLNALAICKEQGCELWNVPKTGELRQLLVEIAIPHAQQTDHQVDILFPLEYKIIL